jgi:hypothetical protein
MDPTTERHLRRIVKAPLAQWATLAAKLPPSQQFDIARAVDSDAERCALLGAYLSALSYGAEHATARKRAACVVTKVRSAMGYSYPGQGLAQASW